MTAIDNHRSIRSDFNFDRKLFSRPEVRRFARLVKSTEFFECFVSDPSKTYRTVRLKFQTSEQKERMVGEMSAVLKAWEAKIRSK